MTPFEALDPAQSPATWAWAKFSGAERAQLGGDFKSWWVKIGLERREHHRKLWQKETGGRA